MTAVDQNQQDYATQLQRALQLTARSPADLESVLNVGIQVDDFTRPEFWPLRRGTRFQAYRSVTAVVGQRGIFQMQGSIGVLTVIEQVTIENQFGAPLTFNYGIGSANAVATGGGVVATDDRLFSVVSPATMVVSGASAAPNVPPGGHILVPNNTTMDVPLGAGIILTGKPNTAGVFPVWGIVCTGANSVFEVTAFYRERPILDSEK